MKKYYKEVTVAAALILMLGCVQHDVLNKREQATIECNDSRDSATKAAINETYDNKGNRIVSDSMRTSKEEALKACMASKGF